MKLESLYESVSKKVIENITQDLLITHINKVKESGNYKNIITRVSHDIKFAVFSAKEVCDWYDEYNCNDDHITTLFKRVIKNNYPLAWDILQNN